MKISNCLKTSWREFGMAKITKRAKRQIPFGSWISSMNLSAHKKERKKKKKTTVQKNDDSKQKDANGVDLTEIKPTWEFDGKKRYKWIFTRFFFAPFTMRAHASFEDDDDDENKSTYKWNKPNQQNLCFYTKGLSSSSLLSSSSSFKSHACSIFIKCEFFVSKHFHFWWIFCKERYHRPI